MTSKFTFKGVLLLLTLLMFVITSCFSSLSTNNNLTLATPESICPASPASWKGIIPGQATKADVERILGNPVEKGYSKRWQRDFFTYLPLVTLGKTSYGNTIFFRDDNVVDWIDVWVSNADGEFHIVAETVEQYGPVLDQVYVNGAFDVFGPEQVYIWSECGIALTAVADGYIKRSEEEVLPLNASLETKNVQLSFRYPVHPRDSIQPRPNVEHIIIRKYLFQPTNFVSFQKFYVDRIRYIGDRRFYRLE